MKRFIKYSFLILLVVGVYWGVRGIIHVRTGSLAKDAGELGRGGAGDQPDLSNRPGRPGNSKVTLKDKLIAAEGDLDKLFELAKQVPSSDDHNLILPILRQLDNFSASQLAQLMLAPSSKIENAVVRMIAQRNDPRLLAQVAAELPKGSEERKSLFQAAGEQMDSLAPETLTEALAGMNPDPGDLLSIGLGLLLKVGRLEGSPVAQMKMIEAYLSATDIPEVRSRIQALWLAKNAKEDPASAATWLLQQNGSEAIYPSDRVVIGALAERSPEKAVEFVNEILDREDKVRAGRAVAAILDTLKQADPIGSLKWVEGLPRDLDGYPLLVSNAFQKVYFSQPEKIDSIMAETKDPYLLEKYSSIKARLDNNMTRRKAGSPKK